MNSPLRVLIVDNQADAREWLAEWFRRKHHFDVETACNDVEAIKCVTEAEGNYDVVLMDLVLGEGSDGIKTMQEIQGRYPDIETIIITGFGGIEEGVRAMQEGAYRYVLKPLNREELVVYVRHAAERRSLKADLQLTEQKHAWLKGLLTVSQALSSRFDLEPTLDIIVAKLQELLGLDTCTIGLFDSDMTSLDIVAEQGLGKKVKKLLKDLPDDLIKQVFASSDILEIPEIDERPNLKKALVRSDLRSFVILPLRGRNEVPLGIITMGSLGKIALSPDQKDLLRVLADQAAIGIENARLYEQAQTQAQQLDVVDEVALKIASPIEIEELFPKIINEATDLLGGAGGGLYLPTETAEQMELKAVYGLPEKFKGMRVDKYNGVVGQVWKTGEPFVQSGYWTWPGRVKTLDEFKFSAVVGVPIHSPEDDLLGVLVVHYLKEGREFGKWKQQWLVRLGRHVGAAIEKTRIIAEQDAISEVAQAVTSILEPRELLDKIFEVLHHHLGYGPPNFGILLKPEFASKWGPLSLDSELLSKLDLEDSDTIVDIQRGVPIKIGGDKGITGIAATGKTVIVGDVTKDSRYLPLLPGCRSEIAVPITIRGKTLGVLNVESTEIDAFDKRDERILTRFAAAIAIALDNARLFDKVKSTTNHLALLLDFAKKVGEAQHLEEALETVTQAMMKVCPSSYFQIMLRNRESDYLTVRAARATDNQNWNPSVRKSCMLLSALLANPVWARNLEDGGYVQIENDDDAGADILRYVETKLALREALQSAFIVPLRSDKKTLGLCIFWRTGREEPSLFPSENMDFARALAAQASDPIEKALWLEHEQERTKVLERLNEVGNAIASTLDLNNVLNLIVSHAQKLLNAEVCAIFLVRRDGFLTLEANHGSPKGSFEIGKELEIKAGVKVGLTGHIAAEGKLFNKHGADLWSHPAIRQTGEQAHLPSKSCTSVLAIPLKKKSSDNEQLIGLLKIENKRDKARKVDPSRGFDSEDELILETLANYAETAVQNAQLYGLTNTLRQVATVVNSTLDLDEVLQQVLTQVRPLISFSTASIQLLRGSELRIVACAGFGEQDKKKVLQLAYRKEDQKFPNYLVIDTKRPFLIDDIRQSHYHHFWDEADVYCSGHIRSWLGVPLLHGDEVIGMLSLESEIPYRYNKTHIDLGVAFAGQVVSAVANAKLYKDAQSMLDFAEGITKKLELQRVLKKVTEDAIYKEGLIGADIAILDLCNSENGILGQKPVYAPAFGANEKISPPFHSESVVQSILLSGEPRISENVLDDDLLNPEFVTFAGIRSAAAFPLIDSEQKPVGVLVVNYQVPRSFNEKQIQIMKRFASDATDAIQKACDFRDINERLVATRNAAIALSAMSAWAHDAGGDTYLLRINAQNLKNAMPDAGPKAREILERITNAAEKIAGLIPYTPTDLNQREPVEINHAFQRAVAKHEAELRQRGIEIDAKLEDLPRVNANEWLLTEALNHLIQNAIKAMHAGGTLSLSGHVEAKKVRVRVVDTGPGIPLERQHQLFKRRLSGSNERGAGVGLMLTWMYLDACDGDIALERSDADGTAFIFHLPLAS